MPHQSLLITHTGIIQALFLRFALLLKDGRSWVKWVGRVRRASPAPSMWVYIHSRTLEGWKMYAVVIMRNYIFPLMHESMKEEEDLTLKVASWILNMHGMNTCSFFPRISSYYWWTRQGHNISFSSESEAKAPISLSYPVWFPVTATDCLDLRDPDGRRRR